MGYLCGTAVLSNEAIKLKNKKQNGTENLL